MRRASLNNTGTMISIAASRKERNEGRFARIAAAGIALSFALCLPAAAAILLPASPAVTGRIDYQTVVVRPAQDATKARVTVFCALRLKAADGEPGKASLLIPVEGIPLSAVAQAIALDRFDDTVTHAPDLEKAFYEQARRIQRGRACLYTAIGATGGLPAWLLLAPRWPARAPPLTAVLRSAPAPEEELPVIEAIRIVPADDCMRLAADRLTPRMLAALLPFARGSIIVVDFSASAGSAASYRRAAATGIRVAYEAPIPPSESAATLRLPTVSAPETPALTRIYVATDRGQEAFFEGIRFDENPPSPQRVADDVADAFGGPDAVRRARFADGACAQYSSTITPGGRRTLRAVVRGRDLPEARVRLEDSGAGALRVTGTAMGALLYALLWPLTAAAYLAALWLAFRAYLWLVSAPVPPRWWRVYALAVVLGPLLTPWFLLRYACRPWPPKDDGDRSGALGAVNMTTYDCVARLAVWGLVVCSLWAVVRALAELAERLRFG